MPKIDKENFDKLIKKYDEVGVVEMVSHPIALVRGLPNVKPSETVFFENGDMGKVTSLGNDYVEVISFAQTPLPTGIRTARTGKSTEIKASSNLLGKTIDPLGHDIYDQINLSYDIEEALENEEFRKIDVKAPGIEKREKITTTFETGVSVVDLLIPLGKGQRELVIGDRKTGKTEFLLQTMLQQAKSGTICIYAGIGKQKIDIKKVEEFADKQGIRENMVILSALSSDPAALVYVAPFTAMTIAEYFRDQGKDTLVVLDDMNTHAKFYREIALLGNRFPGRSAYPADIFYTHSRLLERAGFFRTENGLAAITCLPVAETVEGDISGYIQTNLMSITDGHIFFDNNLFVQGRRPAINYFLSVTRVGRQTQTKLSWSVNRELTNFLSLFENTQSFVHFGAEINEGIKATLSMGERIIQSFFTQEMGKVLDPSLQIIIFCLIWSKAFKSQTPEGIKDEISTIYNKYISDPNFKNKVNEYVKQSEDFNALLGTVSTRQSEFI